MSAAATAAGYLYASGRLRGRGSRDGVESETSEEKRSENRRDFKVAVYQPKEVHLLQPEPQPQAPEARPVRTPKIQYRTRRWKPE
jgi:hypothetical protein